jgi:hypothetical protein
MIDPTLSEAVILRSVRKFFLDAFPGYPVFFEFIERQPRDSNGDPIQKWMCILPSNRLQNTLARADMQIHLFVEGDSMGELSAQFRDEVIGALTDFTQTDCCKRMNCYNSSWELEFIARITVLGDSDYSPYSDGLSLKIIPFHLHWGAK